MLFNQLIDLIYHNESFISNDDCDLFINMIENKTEYTIIDNHSSLENSLLHVLIDYIHSKNSLIKYNFINTNRLIIGKFIIINKDYHNTFDVCHTLNIYKYLIIIYFLDNNSEIDDYFYKFDMLKYY